MTQLLGKLMDCTIKGDIVDFSLRHNVLLRSWEMVFLAKVAVNSAYCQHVRVVHSSFYIKWVLWKKRSQNLHLWHIKCLRFLLNVSPRPAVVWIRKWFPSAFPSGLVVDSYSVYKCPFLLRFCLVFYSFMSVSLHNTPTLLYGMHSIGCHIASQRSFTLMKCK